MSSMGSLKHFDARITRVRDVQSAVTVAANTRGLQELIPPFPTTTVNDTRIVLSGDVDAQRPVRPGGASEDSD